MHVIAHRLNTVAQLTATPPHLGVEIDVRSRGRELYLHHDPFALGTPLAEWLPHFRHGLLVLNVKEEGLEEALAVEMARVGHEDWFFLDQSLPSLLRTARRGEARCAVRVSEHEPVEAALSLAGLVRWVWIDCFTRFPLDRAAAGRLEAAGLRLCVVSPELHRPDHPLTIERLRARLAAEGIRPDAVCTKRPDAWLT